MFRHGGVGLSRGSCQLDAADLLVPADNRVSGGATHPQLFGAARIVEASAVVPNDALTVLGGHPVVLSSWHR